MECCDKKCVTPFCPQCGKLVEDGRAQVLRQHIIHLGGISKASHTRLEKYPDWEGSKRTIERTKRLIEALEYAIALIVRDQKGGGDDGK